MSEVRAKCSEIQMIKTSMSKMNDKLMGLSNKANIIVKSYNFMLPDLPPFSVNFNCEKFGKCEIELIAFT